MPRSDQSLNIRNKILERIRSGIYSHNSFLPPETELAREFGVARNTLRKAIAALAESGFIEKSQGKMSRVCCPDNHKHNFASSLAWLSHLQPENMNGNAIYFEMFKLMVEKARARNIEVHFFSLSPHQPWDNSKLDFMKWTVIFAVGLTSKLVGGENIRILQQLPQLIAIDRTDDTLCLNSVSIDNYASSRLAVEHLLQCGYCRITFVNCRQQDNQAFKERFRGYSDMMEYAGLGQYIDKVEFDSDILLAYDNRPMLSILQSRPQTEVFFCSTDALAIKLLAAAAQLDLAVPDQIGIMGFDGIYAGQHITPRLTTVLQPLDAVVETALDMALKQSVSPVSTHQFSIKIPGKILIGQTTAERK